MEFVQYQIITLFVTKLKHKIQEEQWYHNWKSVKWNYDYFQNTTNK